MKKFLVVVDMQNDFIDGALGTPEAQAIVPKVVEKINSFDGDCVFCTMDTHGGEYFQTQEGRKLPVEHCIIGTYGWQISSEVMDELIRDGIYYVPVVKFNFGSDKLPEYIKEEADGDDFTIEFVGLCTDICVVSNALYCKTSFPEVEISVDSSCCAGVTPEAHEAALAVMRSCQINVY